METEFVWVINPAGRRVEVEASTVPGLLAQEKGYRVIGEEEDLQEDLDKEFLEVIEL